MLKSLLFPNKNNAIIWASALFLLWLLFTGKASPATILFAYFFETIIIGFFNALKMLIVTFRGEREQREGKGRNAGLFMCLFFLVHYGGFVAIQSIFVFSFFEGKNGLAIGDPFRIFKNYGTVLDLENMGWVLVSLFFANLAYFFNNFLVRGQFHQYRTEDLFMLPYIRIVIQQFVVIIAGFFMMLLHVGMAAAVLLILFRLAIDLVIVGLQKNGELAEKLAKKMSENDEQYEQVKEVLVKWSE